jgi:hypothetical protein
MGAPVSTTTLRPAIAVDVGLDPETFDAVDAGSR